VGEGRGGGGGSKGGGAGPRAGWKADKTAQPMREPSKACTIIAKPTRELDVAPVSTLALPELVPAESDVYVIVVHGSLVTTPV